MKSIALLLAHATMEHVNSCVSARDLRTPLHLACAMGNLPVAQLLIWVSQLLSFCTNCQVQFSYH
jgi:Arf-GAP/GTPase/ANK repeat/PH domain-containing protein 1/3